ncbi:unnamed protein product [Mytilus coruscus]|uniref:Uncharacterized protein n=1 Tax=Mytilus coruscus TaxID=42192 RepID=A0A6J8ABW8_MYTCO|nr:unnamed protein product [Mytilus coruscus]
MAYHQGPPLGILGFDEIEKVRINGIVKHLKLDAESSLQWQDYFGALQHYSLALEYACKTPYTTEEIPKILCNKSMVLLKLKRYDEALKDAMFSINDFPYWIKGYWRASNVLKELGQFERAVDILNNGLSACISYSAPKEDQIIFFIEMLTLLCQDKGNTFKRNLQIPQDEATKEKVIQRLILNKSWANISYLVTGVYPGNNVDLAGSFSDLNFSFVPVGNLLRQISVSQKKSWGIQLAIALLRNGASYEQMEFDVGQAAIHIGVQDALETGSTDFLKFLLGTYINTSSKKDMINTNGDTAIHVVIKTGKTNSTYGETILRLLVNYGCKFCHKDMSGKLPIEYLKPTDQGYTLLQTANNNPDLINIPDQRLPQTHTPQQSKNTIDAII